MYIWDNMQWVWLFVILKSEPCAVVLKKFLNQYYVCMYVTYQFICLFVVDIFLSFSVIFVCFTHCCSDHYSWLSVSIIVQKV